MLLRSVRTFSGTNYLNLVRGHFFRSERVNPLKNYNHFGFYWISWNNAFSKKPLGTKSAPPPPPPPVPPQKEKMLRVPQVSISPHTVRYFLSPPGTIFNGSPQ